MLFIYHIPNHTNMSESLQHSQTPSQPAWLRARAELRRKNKPDSILHAMCKLRRALASDGPDSATKHERYINDLRKIICGVTEMIQCTSETDLDTVFKIFVDAAWRLDTSARTTRTALHTAYAVYAMRKAELRLSAAKPT